MTGCTIRKELAPGILAIMLTIFLLSCGSGSANGSGDEPNYNPVIFTADKDAAGTVELYASFQNGNEITKLSGTMVAGGNVVEFKISPNGQLIAYLADQLIDDQFELFVVEVDVGVPVKISQLTLSNSSVEEFEWAPDTSRIAYLANELDINQIELFTNHALDY